MNERRQQQRCPICQGPAIEDPDYPDGVRCRRSTCIHNHPDTCPRCHTQDLESVTYANGEYTLTCRECLNSWTKPE